MQSEGCSTGRPARHSRWESAQSGTGAQPLTLNGLEVDIIMRDNLEADIVRLLTKLRASGHAVDMDAIAQSIQVEHPEIDLEVLKDRIRVHVDRLRSQA